VTVDSPLEGAETALSRELSGLEVPLEPEASRRYSSGPGEVVDVRTPACEKDRWAAWSSLFEGAVLDSWFSTPTGVLSSSLSLGPSLLPL